MKTFPLTVSTPNGNMFQDEAVRIILRGTEGELAVLAGHMPFVTTIQACDCRIESADQAERVGHTSGGILTVGHHGVTLLCGSFRWRENS